MRRSLLIGGAVVVVAVAGALLLLLLLPLGRHGRAGAGGGTLDARSATALQSALDSGDPAKTVTVIANQDASSFDPAAPAALAALHLSIRRDTFQQHTGYATVEATTTSGRWLLTLVRQDSMWKLSDTTSLSR